jgi:Leucine-rich repeat (LRR) protein
MKLIISMVRDKICYRVGLISRADVQLPIISKIFSAWCEGWVMKRIFSLTLAIAIGFGLVAPGAANSDVTADFSCSNVTEISQIECEALVALYDSTGDTNWGNPYEQYYINWLKTNTPSDWLGVTVEGGHVTRVFLLCLNLSGNLPPEMGNLSSLRYLNLTANQITSIPPELGNLSSLQELDLGYNRLTGLPLELGNLSSLQTFNLSENQLTSLPPELGNLSSLQELNLGYNRLTGLPPELGNLSSLQTLDLSGNQLISLPPELGNLNSLHSLSLSDNRLTSLPPELGNWNSLQYLLLSGNQIIGLPPELGNLGNLQVLVLGGNRLTSLPPELGNLSSLQYLYLDHNQLTGIPGGNQFTSIPPELGNLSRLWNLQLQYNQISGSLPPELGSLNSLVVLDLNNNQITGSIPTELGNLSQLEELDLSENQLTGSILPELGNLIDLRELRLDRNQLTGDVPASIANLVNLYPPDTCSVCYGLDLDYNRLNVPAGYPDPTDPLQVFLSQKDPDWQTLQGFDQVIGSAGGTLTALDGRAKFVIPANALAQQVTFSFMPEPMPNHPNTDLAYAGNSFQLSAKDSGGNLVTTFNVPVTVTLQYKAQDVFVIPIECLRLFFWDESSTTWIDASTTCDPAGGYLRDPNARTFSVDICHLSEFAIFGDKPEQLFVPLMMQ